MFGLSRRVRVFAFASPVDMRKSFNTLAGLVAECILKMKALVLERENARLITEIIRLKREILELKGLSPEQLQQELALLDAQLRAAAELESKAASDAASDRPNKGGDPEKKPKEKNPGHGPRPQPNLPIVEKVFDLDDADKICAACWRRVPDRAGRALLQQLRD